MTVTLRPAQNGRIRWRFQEDFDYILSRPAVAPDGTVYSIDPMGHLYAVASNGGLEWIVNVPGTGFGNVSLGSDGTVYTGEHDAHSCGRAEWNRKWRFNPDSGRQSLSSVQTWDQTAISMLWPCKDGRFLSDAARHSPLVDS